MAVHNRALAAVVVVAVLAILGAVESRAVNISNTWVLPEDGFPVFFRYFRDRINWFEADAVCQFHHANLVTVDTGAQFDAARAFLRELDVLSPVWVGLKRGRNQPHFLWTNEQPLSSVGYWNEPLPGSSEELCAAADPAADFRWHGLSCGGLEVASFICELPVPEWAAARDGCMVENLPSLTAAFLPGEAAVELTSDCGLGGTRRVVCKGNTTREALFAQLDCHNMMNEDASLPSLPSGAGQDAEQTEQPEDGYTSTSTETSAGSAGSTTPGEQAATTRQRRATTTVSNAARDAKEDPATTDVSVDTSVPASSTEPSSEPSTSATATATAARTVADAHLSTAEKASSTSRPAEAAAVASTAAPAAPSRPDTLIVAQKDQKDEQTPSAAPKDAGFKEVPSWTPDDKAIIVPVVAKKGPGYPKKAPASTGTKPFRPEKIPVKLRAPAQESVVKPGQDAAHAKDPALDTPEATPTPTPEEKVRVPQARFDVKVSVKKASPSATPSPRPAQATVVEVPKVAVVVDSENKLDSAEFGSHMDANAADDLDDALMIRELSSARTPLIKSLPVVDVPLPSPEAPAAQADTPSPAAASKLNKESPIFLSLPSDGHVVRRPPVKKDGLPAAIAGAAVVTTSTTTTTTTAAPTTAPAATTTEAPSTLSPVRLRESMAGPGGKARTLTTAPPVESSAAAVTASSVSTAAPQTTPTSTTAPTTTTAATTTVTATARNATSVSHSAATETTTPATTSTASTARPAAHVEEAPKESGRRRQHLPAPLLSMNMKPDAEGGEEGLETEPQSPPRPNRSRSLVHQQRRTFYPYFLNRVLG